MLLDLGLWLTAWVLFAASGLMLVIRGWRGRITDHMPHCKTCEYNLTDLVSNVCPECGTAITPEQIVYSLRRRRPGRVAIGVVLLLIAGFLTFGLGRAITRVNWHRYYPIKWLLAEAEAGNWLGPNELRQRLQRNALSDSDVRPIVESVLANQKRRSLPGRFNEVVDLVGFLDAAGKLTKEEQGQLYDQIVGYTLQCRPKIRSGAPIALQTQVTCLGPASLWSEVMLLEEAADGQTTRDYRGSSPSIYGGRTSGSSGNTRSLDSAGLMIGRHTIEVKVRLELYRVRSSDFDCFLDARDPQALIHHPDWKDRLTALTGALRADEDRPQGIPIWTQVLARSVKFEIIPADSPNPIGLIADPSLGAQLKQIITVSGVTLLTEWTHDGKTMTDVGLLIGDSSKGPPVPVDIAFRVMVKTADREIDVGEILCKKGSVNSFVDPGTFVEPFDDEEVSVLLRSSREAALRTADIHAIWDGEITFGPIKVQRSTGRSHSWGTSSPATQPATPSPPKQSIRQ